MSGTVRVHEGTGIPLPQYERAHLLINALPQRRHINPAHIDPWLKAVYSKEPDRLFWHIKRLRGIGGSEIGTAMSWVRGVFSFKHITSLFNEKLLISPPDGGSGHTQRGLYLEPYIAERYCERVGGVRDTEALEALKHLPADSKHSWIGSNLNPDDLVRVDGPKPSRRLPDYKSPAGKTAFIYANEGCPLDYEAQLHLYFYRCKGLAALGMPVDAMDLAPFSCDDWEIYPVHVPYRPEFEAEMLAAGDLFWKEHVLKGIAPQFRFTDRAERVSVDISARQADLVSRYASLQTFGNAAHEMADQIAESLCESVHRDNPHLEGEKYAAGYVQVQVQRKVQYARKQMTELATQLNIPSTAYTTEGARVVNDEKLFELVVAAANAAGLSTAGLCREEVVGNVKLPRINGKNARSVYLRENFKPGMTAFLEEFSSTASRELQTAFPAQLRGALGADLTNPAPAPSTPAVRVSAAAPRPSRTADHSLPIAAWTDPGSAPGNVFTHSEVVSAPAASAASDEPMVGTHDLPVVSSNVGQVLRRPPSAARARLS